MKKPKIKKATRKPRLRTITVEDDGCFTLTKVPKNKHKPPGPKYLERGK